VRGQCRVNHLLGFEAIVEIGFDWAIFQDSIDEQTSANRVFGED
jgi:hypothetical protein